uniref:tRNA methyltransferase 5 n=1 Tax=Oncorhynchus tshawytscha TaxID=74940 RepID=A0A8C8CRA8_ONCTS
LRILSVFHFPNCSAVPSINLSCEFQNQMPVQQQYSAMEPSLYTAPPEVRGLTCLDKEAFAQTVVVPALQRPGMLKLLLLDPASVSSPNSFSDAEVLRSFGVPQELQLGTGFHSGFSQVVHIAHMNLREHQLPYRNIIGQVIMDKNPWVTCVVNKTNTIDSTYRSFKMVMVGEENMVAKVRENGVTYEFDFSCVYWNLTSLRYMTVGMIKQLGPFSILQNLLGNTRAIFLLPTSVCLPC